MLYDYILTVRLEYNYVWRRKWSGAKILFLANRYLVLLMAVMQFISIDRPENARQVSPRVFYLLLFAEHAYPKM